MRILDLLGMLVLIGMMMFSLTANNDVTVSSPSAQADIGDGLAAESNLNLDPLFRIDFSLRLPSR